MKSILAAIVMVAFICAIALVSYALVDSGHWITGTLLILILVAGVKVTS